MNRLIRAVDAASEWTGRFAAWVFFVVGFCIAYEVVMRYVFTAPTVWVDEVARIGQVWATYLAAAYVLKRREMITIGIAFREPGTTARKCADTLGLVVILLFCFVTVRYGFELWLRVAQRGHTTDTYLALPLWFTQASVWIGFLFLALQSVIEIVKIWRPRIASGAA